MDVVSVWPNRQAACDEEIRLIAHYRAIGPGLLNMMDGGDQPGSPPQESRQKMSKSRTGKKARPESLARRLETWAKFGHPRSGAVLSEETRKKIAESLTGRPGHIPSAETRKKISESKIGDKNPNFGKPFSPAANAKRKATLLERGIKERGNPKLTESDVREIRASTDSLPELADRFSVHKATISRILNFETWKDLPA